MKTKIKRIMICEECKKVVKHRIRCIPECGMWLCAKCTIMSLKHNTSFGEHWKMLAKSHGLQRMDII